MFKQLHLRPAIPELPPFAKLMTRLGETFAVRDVMVNLPEIKYVTTEDEAADLVTEKRYSVVPVSSDGKNFSAMYCTEHKPGGVRRITERRETSIFDHIPDSTPLSQAFFLFNDREWYLTIRENRVSGLITYWNFNNREFCVQLYAGLSRVEELSRNALASDECGVSSEEGLKLSTSVLERVRQRYESASKEFGGDRFVDELEFHHVHEALRKHLPWRDFLHARLGNPINNAEYDRLYEFTDLRNAVMHGRTVFLSYQRFREQSVSIDNIAQLIDHLEVYLGRPSR